jgi:hypothetical protein
LSTVRHIYLPYCVQRLKDGRYIILNRRYKPLGMEDTAWVDYDSHPSAHPLKGLTPAKAKAMSHRGDEDVDCIFLYADACIPTDGAAYWDAYSKRLKVLAALAIKEN